VNGPKVDPDDIRVHINNGAQVITWHADSSVASFDILGLEGNGEFERKSPPGKTVTIIDKADRPGEFPYTVSAVRASVGVANEVPVSIDPKITNDSH